MDKRDPMIAAELAAAAQLAPDPTGFREPRPDPWDRYSAPGFGIGADAGDGPATDRRLIRSVEIGQVLASGGSASGTVRFRVVNPSSRLRVKIVISFWPTAPVDAAPTITASTVVLAPWVEDEYGHEAPADEVVSAEPLPYGYEGETFADVFRGTVSLAQGTSLPGSFKVVASWEPAEDMPEARWRALRARCAVARVGSIVELLAGASP